MQIVKSYLENVDDEVCERMHYVVTRQEAFSSHWSSQYMHKSYMYQVIHEQPFKDSIHIVFPIPMTALFSIAHILTESIRTVVARLEWIRNWFYPSIVPFDRIFSPFSWKTVGFRCRGTCFREKDVLQPSIYSWSSHTQWISSNPFKWHIAFIRRSLVNRFLVFVWISDPFLGVWSSQTRHEERL